MSIQNFNKFKNPSIHALKKVKRNGDCHLFIFIKLKRRRSEVIWGGVKIENNAPKSNARAYRYLKNATGTMREWASEKLTRITNPPKTCADATTLVTPS